MGDLTRSELGRQSEYPERYAPEVLHPVRRDDARASLGVGADLPFHGTDYWTAYELSWRNPRGKPVAAVGDIAVPANSPCIVESKSMKLYLNSLNTSTFADFDEAAAVMARDIGRVAGVPVQVALKRLDELSAIGNFSGESLDEQDIDVTHYDLDPGLLALEGPGDRTVSETLYTHLMRSLCPVTAQPDWASVLVRYSGPKISRAALLRYLVSFRNTREFHEHCVERIFTDLRARCRTERLTVYARYTRRGGIDINPFRSDCERAPDAVRIARQ